MSNREKKEQRKTEFSFITKLLIMIGVCVVVSLPYISYKAFGLTTFGVTLTSNPNLESGLVGHWTFDSSTVSTSSVSDRVGSNHGLFSGCDYDKVVSDLAPQFRWNFAGDANDSSANSHDPTSTVGSPSFPSDQLINCSDFTTSLLLDADEGYIYIQIVMI